MKRLFPNTIFVRLFALVLAAILLGHGMVFMLVMFADPDLRLSPGLAIAIVMQFAALGAAAWFGTRLVVRRMQARSRMEERNRFIATVSHGLRVPLARMKLHVERLDDSVAATLMAELREMTDLLDATLAAPATPESPGGSDPAGPRRPFDVQGLVEAMVQDAQQQAQDVRIIGHAAPLHADPVALRRCLSCLIDNALRYGGNATIAMHDSPNLLQIEVRDNGPGIPEEQMDRVFEPFVQLEASCNQATGGIGLGLTIARDAAQRCGATLTLRNDQGGGLIASVLLYKN